MSALHITTENFEKEVLNSDKPVLVDFWASWCGPCRMLMPIIEDIAGETTEAKICKINVDEQPEIAARYNVMTIPTVMIFNKGNVTNTLVGVRPKTEILKILRS